MARVLKISAPMIKAIFDLDRDQWPPNAYAWIGVTQFECDKERIKLAALERVEKIIAVLRKVPQRNVELEFGLIQETIDRTLMLCDSERRPQYDASLYRQLADELEKKAIPATAFVKPKSEPSVKPEEIKVTTLVKKAPAVQPSEEQEIEFRMGTPSLARRHKKKSHRAEIIVLLLACAAGGLIVLLVKIVFF